MPTREPTPVVAAIITNGPKVLLAQRPSVGHNPNKWEFPGGKIEPGETPAEALHRELTEELTINATIGDFLGEVVHEYPHIIIRLMAYRVESWRGTLTPQEHQAVAWAAVEEVDAFDLADADRRLVGVLSALTNSTA